MYLKFALVFLREKSRYTSVFIFLIVICMTMIAFTAAIGNVPRISYNRVDELLFAGAENTAILRIDDAQNEISEEMLLEPEIEAVGSVYKFSSNELYDLLEFEPSEVLTISLSALGIMNINLKSGEIIKDSSATDIEYIYLGSDFDYIPVGTKYISENGITYIVAGILKKGQRWLDDRLSVEFSQNQADYTISCDDKIIEVVSGVFTSDLWMCSSPGYTLDQALKKSLLISEKHNIKLRYYKLISMYNEALADVLTLNSILSKILSIVCIGGVIFIVCIQISEIYTELNNFGIMCSQGFTQREIGNMLLTKNFFVFIMGFLISLFPMYMVLNYWYSALDGNKIITSVFWTISAPCAFCVLIGILVLTTFVSLSVFRKYTPVMMLGGLYD